VASALIAASLKTFAAAGFTHAMLGVDADNPTGAHRLYKALGFERERRSITHQIELER
jgi:ribosomal protein S18 acetylase RimI-like enzyme